MEDKYKGKLLGIDDVILTSLLTSQDNLCHSQMKTVI